MPTYDYECTACGTTHEIYHGMSEAPKKKCPACGKARLKRLLGSGAGFIFKGSGFYITDYRSADYKAKAKAESDGGSSSKPAEGAAKPEAGAGKKPDSKGSSDSSRASGAPKDQAARAAG
ncbi:MAG: zinc ribbon domain-containing protein [Planctomycetes bacterium]|nr:zinc ribbon domain-containing protein [Planctomycetota bacterium]